MRTFVVSDGVLVESDRPAVVQAEAASFTASGMLAQHAENLESLQPDIHARSEEVRRMIMNARFDRAEAIVEELCPPEHDERRARLISIAEQAVREHRDVVDAVLFATALYQIGIEPSVAIA